MFGEPTSLEANGGNWCRSAPTGCVSTGALSDSTLCIPMCLIRGMMRIERCVVCVVFGASQPCVDCAQYDEDRAAVWQCPHPKCDFVPVCTDHATFHSRHAVLKVRAHVTACVRIDGGLPEAPRTRQCCNRFDHALGVCGWYLRCFCRPHELRLAAPHVRHRRAAAGGAGHHPVHQAGARGGGGGHGPVLPRV